MGASLNAHSLSSRVTRLKRKFRPTTRQITTMAPRTALVVACVLACAYAVGGIGNVPAHPLECPAGPSCRWLSPLTAAGRPPPPARRPPPRPRACS